MADVSAGYSGTPLAKKLGIQPGDRVGVFGAPADFDDVVAPLPDGARLVRAPRSPCPVLIAFAITPKQLADRLAAALKCLPADGGLWLAWPKKTSAVASDLSFDRVQRAGLDEGLVDNKIAAVDATWSGLRMVVRRDQRAAWRPRS